MAGNIRDRGMDLSPPIRAILIPERHGDMSEVAPHGAGDRRSDCPGRVCERNRRHDSRPSLLAVWDRGRDCGAFHCRCRVARLRPVAAMGVVQGLPIPHGENALYLWDIYS